MFVWKGARKQFPDSQMLQMRMTRSTHADHVVPPLHMRITTVKECAQFMAGKKLVAIISDAASTGISLHASRQAQNQRRRVHLTIEVGGSDWVCWSGRAHGCFTMAGLKFFWGV
jgi:hypothetical protein